MSTTTSQRDEYLTIIAPTALEVMQQFKAQGLDKQGYAIAGRIGRHQFSLVGAPDSAAPLPGDGMIAATFSRKVAE